MLDPMKWYYLEAVFFQQTLDQLLGAVEKFVVVPVILVRCCHVPTPGFELEVPDLLGGVFLLVCFEIVAEELVLYEIEVLSLLEDLISLGVSGIEVIAL